MGQWTKVGEEGKASVQATQSTNSKEAKREAEDDDDLDDMPTLTKETLQFLRCESDDDQAADKEDHKSPLEDSNESDEGSEAAQEDEALARFLRENQLGHLYKKFEQFGITASNIKTLTALSLEQLGIARDDQQKLLRVLH